MLTSTEPSHTKDTIKIDTTNYISYEKETLNELSLCHRIHVAFEMRFLYERFECDFDQRLKLF